MEVQPGEFNGYPSLAQVTHPSYRANTQRPIQEVNILVAALNKVAVLYIFFYAVARDTPKCNHSALSVY